MFLHVTVIDYDIIVHASSIIHTSTNSCQAEVRIRQVGITLSPNGFHISRNMEATRLLNGGGINP